MVRVMHVTVLGAIGAALLADAVCAGLPQDVPDCGNSPTARKRKRGS
jgi:hypothetical protein